MSCAVMTYGEQVCQQLRAETEPLKAVGQKTARPEHLKARRWQQQTVSGTIFSFHSIYRSYTPPFAQCFHLQHINRHAHSTDNKQLCTALQKAGSLMIRLSM